MKPRHKRLAIILGALCVIGLAVALVLNALKSNLAFFYTPTQVETGEAPHNRVFRVGGLVKGGTLARKDLTVSFVITDTARDLTVRYTGILPDLFKEGKGAVAQGRLDQSGVFVADEILAKHDENYMPPEAKHAVESAQKTNEAVKP